MKTVAILLLQSLLSGDRSPNDPPKAPTLQKHDHVVIVFAEPAKADGERRVRWDKELKDWVRVERQGDAAASSMTAEVVDVRPNGALVLQAVKRRQVNRDEEIVRLTCEVAAEHVREKRTSSEHLANLTVSYDGAAAEGAKPGLLASIFGKWWPF